MEEVALEVVVVILVSADPGVIPMFVNVQIYQGNGEVIIKVVLKRVPLILIVVDMEVVDHFKIKINERWSKILDHLSISNRMKLLMFFIFFTYTQSFNSISMSAKLVFEEDNREVLDSAFFRLIYKVEQQALKEGDPFTVIDTMALDVGETWSVYYDMHKSRRDSISKADFKNNPPRSFSLSRDQNDLQERLNTKREIIGTIDESKGETMKIYKNRQNGEFSIFDKGPLEGFSTFTYLKITEKVPPQDWEITEDTLTLLGYPCHKATTDFRGRSHTVWFTLDIPVNDGPWKLYGLPGMILKVEVTNGVFNFQAIGLQELSNTNIHFPSDKKVVLCESVEKLTVFRKKRFEKISIGFSESGGGVTYFTTRNPIVYPEIEIVE